MYNIDFEREQKKFIPKIEDMSREELVREIIATELLLNDDHSRPFVVMVLHYLEDLTNQFQVLDNKLKGDK